MMIDGYKNGSNITIFNTIRHYPYKNDNGKWTDGALSIIYRDNNTKQKHVQVIENPDYEFYKLKDDVQIDHNELFIDKNKVDKITVPNKNLLKEIAVLTDNTEFFYDNIRNGNSKANSVLHKNARIFNSDQNLEDHYRFRFAKLYQNDSFKLKKCFFDIEVDGIEKRGDFPELGECPVNAITAINEFENKTYTFLLRDKRNPLIEEFEKSISPNLFMELKSFIRKEVHGWKNEIRFGLDKMEYEILFFDEEIDLIRAFFRLMNIKSPDFAMAWNMAFDIPYLIQRIINLGYDPREIICHPDFKYKECKYYIDSDKQKQGKDAERGDFATISSYIVYIDQMIQFASRRKSSIKSFDNIKLDYIGEVITGVRKLDYSHITTRIEELPWKNYKIFVFYNIMDTIVQKCIESKVADIDYTFNKCLINNTRYQKCHRQTVYLVNRGCSSFYKNGYIMGNNINRDNTKVPFPGAFVAEVAKISDYPKYKMGGCYPITIYPNCDDFDYKSLYPSEMREFNIAPNTQKGKIYIPDKVNPNENPYNSEIFDRGGVFLEDLQSHNYLEFCTRYFNLADFKTLYKDVHEYLSNEYLSSINLHTYDDNGYILPMQRTNNLNINPIHRLDEDEKLKVFDRCNTLPDLEFLKNIDVGKVVYHG